jgi:hypothetical protein
METVSGALADVSTPIRPVSLVLMLDPTKVRDDKASPPASRANGLA